MARSAPGVDAVSGLGFPLWEIALSGSSALPGSVAAAGR